MVLPFERERTSTGRLKIVPGRGVSPAKEYRFLMRKEDVSMATMRSREVPIQTVEPSAERSALLAAGMETFGMGGLPAGEKTATRVLVRIATKKGVFAGQVAER